ncbi:MAG: hypothetical protein IKU08_05470 [Clostridia bacterium]|nr:hypothetical protein [Clostridia bacterium]
MTKKTVALILAVSLLLSGFSLTGEVSDARRNVEGCIETVVRAVKSVLDIRSYSDYTELFEIPETENGYVPQGYCFSEAYNAHFISYYHDDAATVISLIDGENGEKIKTLSLKKSNGKDFTGHAGGIAEDGQYLYVVDGKKIYRISLTLVFMTPDGDSLPLVDKVNTDVKCSYLNSDGTYLYAGEFYTFTSSGSYDTDKSHHMAISLFETTYARCNAYNITNLEFRPDGDEISVPSIIFTTPNCVQGFARMPDGTFALSISYGRNNNSTLAYYKDVTLGESDFVAEYENVSVPAYHLRNSTKTESLRQPPLLEGIDDMKGKASGIFESCAQKYGDAAFIVDKICIFN